ncbi:MAG: 50S ribosomal protein L30 [Negativicutes bacterium]|jgi:large subunit ribosomal protein L30
MGKIKITLKRSLIGRQESQRKVVVALGLKKTNSSVVHEDTPAIRGMVRKVVHLISVDNVE